VVGIANNHALDLGEAGAVATVSALRGAGLKVSGGAEAAVLHHAGRRTAVTAHDLSSRVPPSMAGDLARARAAADDLVATLHVTGPPSYLPRAELRTAVGLSLAAGARVVAAHGTHALGPVERRGQAVVAWGLGNLLFSCDCTEERDAAILRVALAPDRVHAAVFPIDAGLFGQSARLARDADLSFDLLRAIGSSPLTRFGSGASF
jgi:poly-gamma-glutamate capsule biosynthesis protein CapA/YwtB (metallophosphatase superfamily)